MKNALLVSVTLGLIGLWARAEDAAPTALRLPSIISDHMMLQSDQPDPIWGWAPAGTAVKIDFNDGSGKNLAHADVTAAADGKWSANLPTLAAGEAGQLVVSAGSETKTIQDVLVGEDWLCSGQSNMEYIIGAAAKEAPQFVTVAQKEATAVQGAVRFFVALRDGQVTPQDDVHGMWHVPTPENVKECSAVAWNFAVSLQGKLNKPVGVIDAAVGGSAAETWMPMETFKSLTVYPAMEKRFEEDAAKDPGSLEKMDPQTEAWFKSTTPAAIEATCLAHGGRPLGSPLPGAPKDPDHPAVLHTPARFYNGMINGLVPYGIKGVLWYQGDANAQYFKEYPELIKGLILSWRKIWGAELPFYYVETQNMMTFQAAPVEDTWKKKSHGFTPELREAQEGALELPKTDVATAIDLNTGPESAVNPHYPNKKPLGERLANLAAEQVYGQNLGEVHSPAFASFKIEGDKVRITLTHADGLRSKDGGPLKGFAIRGGNGPWVWGDATIDDNDILVSSSQVPNPTAVRYGWALNPIKFLSVENGAGLPLRPFRTDKDTPPQVVAK